MWLGQPARADLASWCTNPTRPTLSYEDAILADAKAADSAKTSDAKANFYDQQATDSDTAATWRVDCAAQTSDAAHTWNLLFAATDLLSMSVAYHKLAEWTRAKAAAGGEGYDPDSLLVSAGYDETSAKGNRAKAQAIFKQITRTYGSDQVKVYNGLHYLLFGS